jgi:hypothetical protein
MCQEERMMLQQGMNFRPRGRRSVILMSLRKGAPYADRVEDGGRTLIYEGHDVPHLWRARTKVGRPAGTHVARSVDPERPIRERRDQPP